MDKFLFNFYNIVDDIINFICITDEIKNKLNHCNFDSNNINNDEISESNYTTPIIFCLGGMAYKMYEKIIQEQNINIKLDSDTLDFDFSFSLKNNGTKTLQLFEDELKILFNNLIKDYTFTFDEDINYKLNYKTIDHTNFKFNVKRKYDRLHIIINCDIMKNLHILELSFWYNNKISDSFTINDFNSGRNKILIYNSNKLNYYLLPLNLLVKTTFSAIFEFLERRNYDKCYKYIQRINFIKNCNNEYIININNLILTYIFISYNEQIRKKYKIINDYPFIITEETQKIAYNARNHLTRCIHQDYRNDNLKNITSQINIYKEKCEPKVNKHNISKYTEEEDKNNKIKNTNI